MGRSAPRELSEAPGATRPRPPWGRVAGAVVAVLAVLLTALVAPVNGGWWWVQRAAFILTATLWCVLFGAVLWVGRRAAGPAGSRRGPRWARILIAVVAVLFGTGAHAVLGATVSSLVAGPQELRLSQGLSLGRPGARSEYTAHLLTEAGEKLDVSVSGAVRSGVDSQLRYLCVSHAPFTMRWYPSKGPVLEVREG